MSAYLRISNEPAPDGRVVFLVNKTKCNFVNTGGDNSDDVIDCVHAFLARYGIWHEKDQIIKALKPLNYVPIKDYHNISFVLIFYNLSVAAKEAKDKEIREKENEVQDYKVVAIEVEKNSVNDDQTKIIHRPLLNPNIDHTNATIEISKQQKPSHIDQLYQLPIKTHMKQTMRKIYLIRFSVEKIVRKKIILN